LFSLFICFKHELRNLTAIIALRASGELYMHMLNMTIATKIGTPIFALKSYKHIRMC